MPNTFQPTDSQSKYRFDPVEVSDLTNLDHWNGSKNYCHYFSVIDTKKGISFGYFYSPEEAEALLVELENGQPNKDLSLNLGLVALSELNLDKCNPNWVDAHKKRIAALEGVKS